MKSESKHLWTIVGVFPVFLVLSNILATAKLVQLWPETTLFGVTFPALVFPGGTLLFPITYLFCDVLGEVYGREIARRVIWLGFLGMLITTLSVAVIGVAPAPPFWPHQEAYESVLMSVWRVNLGSLLAFLIGSNLNCYVLARMKDKTPVYATLVDTRVGNTDRQMAHRFVMSTVVGEFFDSMIFFPIAFLGVISLSQLAYLAFTAWVAKVLWEVVALPITKRVVRYLERVESLNVAPEYSSVVRSPGRVEDEVQAAMCSGGSVSCDD